MLGGLAAALQRPVRWTETRSESMQSLEHGRAQRHEITIGGTRDGDVQAYRLKIVQDAGAYPGFASIIPVLMTRTMAPSVYDIPAGRVRDQERRHQHHAGRRVPGCGPSRGGRGDRAGHGPVRARDRARPGRGAAPQPGPAVLGADHDGDGRGLRRRRLRGRARRGARRRRTTTTLRAEQAPPSRARRPGADGDRGQLLRRDHRQVGHRGQPAGGRPDPDPRRRGGDRVHGDLAARPGPRHVVVDDRVVGARDPDGPHRRRARRHRPRAGRRRHVRVPLVAAGRRGGAAGRHRGGRPGPVARRRAARGRRRRRRARQGHRRVPRRAAPRRWRSRGATSRPPASENGHAALDVESNFVAPGPTYPFGAHLAVVDVDVETGKVELVRHVACDDAGTVLNPLLFEGQVHGGIAQGVAQALLEEFALRRRRQPRSPGTSPTTRSSPPPSSPTSRSCTRRRRRRTTRSAPRASASRAPSARRPPVQSAVIDALLGLRRPPPRHAARPGTGVAGGTPSRTPAEDRTRERAARLLGQGRGGHRAVHRASVARLRQAFARSGASVVVADLDATALDDTVRAIKDVGRGGHRRRHRRGAGRRRRAHGRDRHRHVRRARRGVQQRRHRGHSRSRWPT